MGKVLIGGLRRRMVMGDVMDDIQVGRDLKRHGWCFRLLFSSSCLVLYACSWVGLVVERFEKLISHFFY
jgi:hypothetical protein